MNAIVISIDGRRKPVLNLGWMLRHWQQITRLQWESLSQESTKMTPDGIFRAFMIDGRIFETEYASFEVWKAFIDRPVLRGLQVTVDGITGIV